MSKFERMGRNKVPLICLITMLVVIESIRSQYQDPDCPDNGMRKPPRFGKRGSQTLLHYSGSPCVRGPVRRTINGPPKKIKYPFIDALIDRIRASNSDYNEN